MLQDVLHDLIDDFKTRTKSRIVSSYLMSFVVCNWLALTVLAFDSLPYRMRAEDAKNNFISHPWHSFFLPLVMALLWVYLLPCVNYLVEKWRHKLIHWMELALMEYTIEKENLRILKKDRLQKNKITELLSEVDRLSARGNLIYQRTNIYIENRRKFEDVVRGVDQAILGYGKLQTGLENQGIGDFAELLSWLIDVMTVLESVPSQHLEEDIKSFLREIRSSNATLKERRITMVEGNQLEAIREAVEFFLNRFQEAKKVIENYRPMLNDVQLGFNNG